jgi:4-hydroxybenzoate polyprenyltransferase
MVLAVRGWPGWRDAILITIAMAAARTAAMSLNRLIDREIDKRNPRTAGRPLPSGRLTAPQVLGASVLSLAVLALSAWLLSPLALELMPIAAVFLVGYHYTKRFTWLSHYVLGITDAGAPLGAWAAVANRLDPPAFTLALAVATWIAGFDLLYSCQDVAFDRANRLKSVPARFGIPAALALARGTHVVTVAALAITGILLGLHPVFYLGCVVAVVLLGYEHSLVKPNDLSRLDMAFFNVNGYLAVAVFICTLLAVALG